MKRALTVALALSVVVLAVGAAGQSKPNFAGKWVLVPDPTVVNGAGRSGIGATPADLIFDVVQDDKTLRVVRNNGTHTRVFNLDGSEAKNAITSEPWASMRDSSIVTWAGAKMILSMREGRRLVMTQTWSLDATGKLVIESTSNIGGTPTTTKATYKKG